jgi:hypothetical protein
MTDRETGFLSVSIVISKIDYSVFYSQVKHANRLHIQFVYMFVHLLNPL